MENNFWSQFSKVLKVSVVIINMFITNILFIILSVISLFILTPVCIAAAMNMSRSILNKDYDDLLIKYLVFIKKNAIKSFKVSFPLIVIIIIVLFNILYFNDIVLDYTNSYVVGIMLLLQLFVGFEAFNIMMLSLIQMMINPFKKTKVIIRDAFLIGNRYFFRMIISSSVIGIVFKLGYDISILFFLISTTLTFLLYYASFSFIINKHFDTNGNLL